MGRPQPIEPGVDLKNRSGIDFGVRVQFGTEDEDEDEDEDAPPNVLIVLLTVGASATTRELDSTTVSVSVPSSSASDPGLDRLRSTRDSARRTAGPSCYQEAETRCGPVRPRTGVDAEKAPDACVARHALECKLNEPVPSSQISRARGRGGWRGERSGGGSATSSRAQRHRLTCADRRDQDHLLDGSRTGRR